jgi:hypothetical protein
MESNTFDLQIKSFDSREWNGYHHPNIKTLENLLNEVWDTSCLKYLVVEREMLLEDQREFWNKILERLPKTNQKCRDDRELNFYLREGELEKYNEYDFQLAALKQMRISLRNYQISDSKDELKKFIQLRDIYFKEFLPKYMRDFQQREGN